jgi:cytochrome b
MRKATIAIWDPLVRAGHWLLAAAVLTAWLTRKGGGRWHEWAGYASLAVVGVRLIWGWCGTSNARFATFVRSPAETLRYARAVLTGQESRCLGHNPVGAWMIVALLANVALVGASGWLYTTDRFWGVEWVEELHAALADILLWLVALHVAGVLYASLHHRENLIAAMWHGRKRALDGNNGPPSR